MLTALAWFAVLVLLGANAGLGWYVVRLVRARSPAPEALMLRMTEVEQEFAAMADAQSRFLKKLSKRDRDQSRQLTEPPAASDDPGSRRDRVNRKLAALRIAGSTNRNVGT